MFSGGRRGRREPDADAGPGGEDGPGYDGGGDSFTPAPPFGEPWPGQPAPWPPGPARAWQPGGWQAAGGPAGRGGQPGQDRDEVLTPTTIIAPGGRIIPPEHHHEGSAGEFPHPGRLPGHGAPGHGAPAGPEAFPPPGYGPVPGYEFGQARGDAAGRHQQGPGGPGPVAPGYQAPGGPMPREAPEQGYPGGTDYASPASNPGPNYAAQNGYPGQNGGYPGPDGYPGPASSQWPAGQPAEANWPGPPVPGPGGFSGPVGLPGLNPYGGADGYPGQPPHPGPASYPPGPNDSPAPGGRGYQGPSGYDMPVNGGEYAYVIREGPKAGPSSAAPRPGPWSGGDGRPAAPAARETARQQDTAQQADTRAIPAVTPSAGSAAPATPSPDLAYGPDDPAYGPPGPDWYLRAREEPEPATTASTRDPAAGAKPVRSSFEPLARSGSGPGTSGPGTSGPDDSTLGQLKGLYASAERMRPQTSGSDGQDRQFEQLLARQRTLISEYFRESGGLDALGLAGREPGAQDAGDDSAVSFGQRAIW